MESIDDQALGRTRPTGHSRAARPLCNRHSRLQLRGTTTLFAALKVLDGTVLGRCMQRYRHHEFIRFLNRLAASVCAGNVIHIILNNYVSHKHPGHPPLMDCSLCG